MTRIPTLDVDWLRAFVSVSDTRSFTAAGEGLAATQSTISVRIRKLEERLGQRLLERNPRLVELTAQGERFLDDARRVLRMHDEAAARAIGLPQRRAFEIGVSDHAAGSLLPGVLASLRDELPGTQFLVTVGFSRQLLAAFEAGRFDAVIGSHQEAGADGEVLLHNQLVWTCAGDFEWRGDGAALPLVSLAPPCTIRDVAASALGAAGIGWHSVFIGTGVAAVQAGISAGLGVACLDTRNVPAGCRVIGGEAGLPELPKTQVVMRMRDGTAGGARVRGAVAAAFRQACGAGLA